MLQNLRDNLKGAVAVVVIIIFVVPLVLFGVEQLFVGSVGGNDAATVNGEPISTIDLQRELTLEKNRMQQEMNLEPSDPRLEDSALMGPVLDRMVQREALLQAAREGGMGASKDDLWQEIAQIEAFQVDGKFDRELFRERISFMYTPATFLEASAKDHILRQLNGGLRNTSFTTELEVGVLASIMQQQRTFFVLDIPRATSSSIDVSEEEIAKYYEENSNQFLQPESVIVEYVELSLSDVADKMEVSETEIQNVYEAEVAEFDADPKYVVAHILVEDKENQSEIVETVQSQLAEGQSFEALAKEYSDDLGSRDNGGELGEMIDEAYPEEFVAAAKQLDVGDISDPVESDAGIHIIKLVGVNDAEPPAFEERKTKIKNQLARQKAQEEFVLKSSLLDEKTFGADSLSAAAEALNVEVQTSPSFTRSGGAGIATHDAVVEAAFAEDVLKQSHNSRVLNIDGNKAVVLRLKEHKPEALKPLDSVAAQIKQRLITQAINEQLQEKSNELIAKLNEGVDAQELAEQEGLEYQLHSAVSRTSFDGKSQVLQKAFSLARPAGDGVVLDQVSVPGAGRSVIGLLSVENGELENMEENQQEAARRQLAFQMMRAEITAFEQALIESAEVERPDNK